MEACTTGAAYYKCTLFLIINIDESLTLDIITLNGYSTIHTNLFVGSNYDFQRRMRYLIAVKKCQSISYSNSIIATKAGLICPDILSVCLQLKRILLHVDLGALFTYSQHVHVSLQDNRLMILIALSSGLFDDNIKRLILSHIEISVLCEFHKEIANLLYILRAMRNITDFLKPFKYFFGF